MAEKDAEIWTLSFFRSEKVRKFELCKFYVGKGAKSCTLSFWTVIFIGGKKCGKLDFVIFDGGKVWKIDFVIFYVG